MLNNRYINNGKPSIYLNTIQKKAKLEVERKIATNIYSFEQVVCPICEHTEYELLAEKDRYGLYCNTVICKTCGLLITNPAMTKVSLDSFYSDDYRELYVGLKKAQRPFFTEQYKHGKRIADFIKNCTDISLQNLFILEVGCGAGGILSAFKEEGAETLGLDLGSDYLEYGVQEHNLCLQQGSIENYTGRKPDIIIYSHVLEHCQLPNELFNIKKISHEKTLIYIEVPGLLSVHKNYVDFMLYLQNAHLFHFSLGTLTNLLSKYGFSLVYGDENISSLFAIHNNSREIINHYNKNIKYLIETEKKRMINQVKRKTFNMLANVLKKAHLYKKIQKIYHNFK
jgi:2-polyprenyl-3-methyl-5-hydroxy-6-metoxy-1,4-benzoquinol methylase